MERRVVFTWRHRERDVTLFAEAHGEDGVRRGVVTKPVGAVVGYGAVDTHHQVAVEQHLGEERRNIGDIRIINNHRVQYSVRCGPIKSSRLTLCTVATQMLPRFRGSTASSFMPSSK